MIPTANPLRPSRLLVVDDTVSARATIEATLVREGHEIMHAASGAECLRVAVTYQPDLILLDVMMPEMDGFETCRKIREDPRLQRIPVVMVTALSDNDSMARGIEAGADDFIGKPFNKWELRARVSALIRLGHQQRTLAERDRFFWVFEHAADGFVLLDRAGGILHCNEASRRLLGFGVDEPAQGDFVARVTRDNVPYPTKAWEHWGDPGVSPDPFYLVRAVAGATYSEWMQVTPYRDPHDPEGMVVVNIRDVTKQVERQMRQFEFHELVSHKLRTPLFGVVGSVDLLARSRDLMPGENERRMLDIAVKSARRLSDAVTDVLDFVDKGAQREAPLALRHLAELVRETASEQHVERVSVEIDAALADAAISLGEISMRTILRELIENARRFHPRETPLVTVHVAEVGSDWLRIDVEDDGVSMTPGQLEHALEPYVQGAPALAGEVPGMGLGLSLVATRVRGAGGRCLIENRSDRAGVRVRLVLPRQVA